MGTLRDEYVHGTETLRDIVSQFHVPTELININAFKVLSPDTFIWDIHLGDGDYYLYSEDYTDSIRVRQNIKQYSGGAPGEFILLRTAPKKPRRVYGVLNGVNIEAEEEMDRIAIVSGFDHIFLYKKMAISL